MVLVGLAKKIFFQRGEGREHVAEQLYNNQTTFPVALPFFLALRNGKLCDNMYNMHLITKEIIVKKVPIQLQKMCIILDFFTSFSIHNKILHDLIM